MSIDMRDIEVTPTDGMPTNRQNFTRLYENQGKYDSLFKSTSATITQIQERMDAMGGISQKLKDRFNDLAFIPWDEVKSKMDFENDLKLISQKLTLLEDSRDLDSATRDLEEAISSAIARQNGIIRQD